MSDDPATRSAVVDASLPVLPAAVLSGRPRRFLVATLLGTVGGAGAIGGMWLPLANLAGLGSVGCFDYNHARVYACITVASLVVVFSIARCFRIVLASAGLLCGLLSATGIDLYQALRDVTNFSGGDLAQMARQMVAHSSLQAGSWLLPLCSVACLVASMLGTAPGSAAPAVTSES